MYPDTYNNTEFFCSNDICSKGNDSIGNTLMCPSCEKHCPFWHLDASCTLSKLTYVFDNDMTVFFALFMSFWGNVQCNDLSETIV